MNSLSPSSTTPVSSNQSTPLSFCSSTVMGKEECKRVLQLLQSLIDSPDSYQFRQPVDWELYKLPDYPLLIKRPMDLGTVKTKLQQSKYQLVQDCLLDIQLIWENCKIQCMIEGQRECRILLGLKQVSKRYSVQEK